MKKVAVFLLAVTLALGGLAFAHAAVTDSQDKLMVYPTLQIGDASVLDGRTASVTFSCGDHLRWYTDYTFGSGAQTEFRYLRQPMEPPRVAQENRMEVYLTAGFGTSVSGGSFSLNGSEYGSILRAVAAITPDGESSSMNLPMADYVAYYQPDYDLYYADNTLYCSESASAYGFLSYDYPYMDSGAYRALMDAFRFPVQKDHILSVTVTKDSLGQVTGIEFYSENGPELDFRSAVNGDGIWFVPVFRDENGTPLPYESPAGHGIYFLPWKASADSVNVNMQELKYVTPDVSSLRMCFPLDETVPIEHMIIDTDSATAQILTRENGFYVLTTCSLQTGDILSRLEVLPYDAEYEGGYTHFFREEEYLVIQAQDQLALTDAAGERLFLTAPDTSQQRFGLHQYNSATGDLYFDGETLILSDPIDPFLKGAFWTAAWRQGEVLFYGEYDCSLLRGNDHWYSDTITANEFPIQLITH